MHRSLGIAWLLPLLAAWPASAGDDDRARAAIQRDLALEIALTSKEVVQPGEPVHVRSRILNRSPHAYKIAAPRRYPLLDRDAYAFFSAASVDAQGKRTPILSALGHAGKLQARQHREVITLAPGAAFDLTSWVWAPDFSYDFQQAGPVELRLHYKYARGATPLEGVDAPTFELVSAPVRFTVVRHVDIRLEVTGHFKAGTPQRISEVLRLHVKNLRDGPVPVSGAEIMFAFPSHSMPPKLYKQFLRFDPTVERKSPPLAGGATRTWGGRPAWDELPDWQFTMASAGWFEVVARWRPTGTKADYASAPVRLEIR